MPRHMPFPRQTLPLRRIAHALLALTLLLMMVELGDGIPRTITTTSSNGKDTTTTKDEPLMMDDSMSSRWSGLISLMKARPSLCFGAVIRIGIAMALEVVLDTFLKTVVTPAVAATGIGIAVAPVTFFMEQALQPLIHVFAFIIFDDGFLLATLEATGIKDDLVLVAAKQQEWHQMSFFEGFVTRHIMKSMAGFCLGLVGLFTVIPVLGPLLTAFLTGWVVAWDYVYVPLSGMGYKGPIKQFRVVWKDFRAYQWYGFWAVLVEEIPVIGPAMHVYNVYCAAFFLERLYTLKNLGDDATAATVDSIESWPDEL